MSKGGVLRGFQAYLEKRRIGELLLSKGLVSPGDLRTALSLQKQTGQPLGQILLEISHISKGQLAFVLWQQTALRVCATVLLFVVSLSGGFTKKARADNMGYAPAQITQVSITSEFTKMSAYPALYGMDEKRSSNLKPFTKWTEMLSRFESQLQNESSAGTIKKWERNLASYRSSSIKAMAENVNTFVNKTPYVSDAKNWKQSDYWATPIEFAARGGDCEDFAITKYVALRSLGVPEDRMRIAIVQDTQKNIPHAVLVVYTEAGAYILDNQNQNLVSAENGSRYRPIYSINRQAWWLHSAPEGTRVASAQ
ncbi:MAG: transglutaminase-like cysteine peptidase [Alphaproteobacteria bacterium]|nr:transglutaminase-like cysteine peptidase [Alphaproteobacteria bacterium]